MSVKSALHTVAAIVQWPGRRSRTRHRCEARTNAPSAPIAMCARMNRFIERAGSRKAAAKSEEQGNNNAVVLGGVVLVAIAGLAVAGGNNGEGAEGGMAATPAAAAPAAAATDADDEVKKVQAWVAAYKKRSGMA